jgi:hypothetical protein
MDGWMDGQVDRRMDWRGNYGDVWLEVYRDSGQEAHTHISHSRFSYSLGSHQPAVLGMRPGTQVPCVPAISVSSTTKQFTHRSARHRSSGKAVNCHSRRGASLVPCASAHVADTELPAGDMKPRAWRCCREGDTRATTVHSRSHPTSAVCFLNKPRDRAMQGYKSAGNQMLTCK